MVNQFGESEYKDFIYLNFEQQPTLNTLFGEDLSPQKIINNIGLYLGRKIVPENTLLFFDEVQAVPKVLTSLKYFYEQSPEYHVIEAGSLLGVSVSKENSFPVGKVNFMTLFPMSFIEYLTAFGEELLVEKLVNLQQLEAFPEIIHNKFLTHLKTYLFLGGMPEVLQDYKLKDDIASVREIQNEILEAYKRDFSKYTSKSQAIKTSEVWSSIPWQLAKEKKKFKYAEISNYSRSSTYEQSIEWLNRAELINIANNISVPKLPLSGYTDHLKFKIYLLDTGLLGAMLKLSSAIIVEPTELFSEYNGAFTENFVASELVAVGADQLFYWASNNETEVDFIIEKENEIYPLEVKSGLNRNLKSLRSYADKYHPKLMYRLSPRNFIQSDDFINQPLYAISFLFK